jgi:hypothetical protein
VKDYDGQLRAAKDYTTKTLARLAANKNTEPMEVSNAVDLLNKAWDELTDALVRQREERDKVITRLINELAERKE